MSIRKLRRRAYKRQFHEWIEMGSPDCDKAPRRFLGVRIV